LLKDTTAVFDAVQYTTHSRIFCFVKLPCDESVTLNVAY